MNDPLDRIDEWGPEKVICVSDTRTGMKGVLVIDNTARGIGKGGTRMHPAVSVDEIARLARVMTWKWAIVELGYGGAKAGIVGDPRGTQKEHILRAFVRRLRNEVPDEYVFGLDVGLNETDAAIIRDELGIDSVVGTPRSLGGLPYDELGLTGFGVAEAADEAAREVGAGLAGRSVSIQGFGAVGRSAARRCSDLGATITAISTRSGVLHHPDGLDLTPVLDLAEEVGDEVISAFTAPGLRRLPLGDELFLHSDVLIPAATQDVIRAETVTRIKARLIVEGANLPITNAAQVWLRDNDKIVVPDVVANAGGIIAAAHAMDYRRSAFSPDVEAIRQVITTQIRANTATVLDHSRQDNNTTHDAARTMAQDRVREAMRVSGRLGVGTVPTP